MQDLHISAPIPDAGNSQIFSPTKERESHDTVFTNSFHPSQQRKNETINAAG